MPDGMRAPRQTVILAAGNGERLGTLAHGFPKPLLRVGGVPLIEHAIAQAAQAGCEEAVIVLGHGARQLEQELGQVTTPIRIRIALNPQYDLPNGISLLAAERLVDERFFLQMADHVFSEPVLHRLNDPSLDGALRLLVDHSPRNLDEADATKVRISAGRVSAIGKDVVPYDAVDAGCFLLDRRVFAALRSLNEETASVSAGMERLASTGALAPIRLEGVVWVDVDTPSDWERAEQLLSR